MRKRQSLTALRAFEAVARHGSMAAAAAEMVVTRPAISKQIRLLEEQLNSDLLMRHGNSVSLTPVGEELFSGLHQAFDLIALTVDRIESRQQQENKVRLLVERDFASAWLADRIGQFLMDYPGISVEIVAEENTCLRKNEEFSFRVCYRHSGQNLPLLYERELCRWIDFPVCSVTYFNGADRHYLLDRSDESWRQWLNVTGETLPSLEGNHTILNETTLCLSMAMSGVGMAMGDSLLALKYLQEGSLIAPFSQGVQSDEAYVLLSPTERRLTEAEKSFEKWLFTTMESYQQYVSAFLNRLNIKVVDTISKG